MSMQHALITYDNQGYVRIDGIIIEHYDREPSWEEMVRLRQRCIALEKIGVPINSSTVVWYSTWFEGVPVGSPYLWLMRETPNLWENGDLLGIDFRRLGQGIWIWNGECATPVPAPDRERYKHMIRHGWRIADVRQELRLGVCYGYYGNVAKCLERHNVPEYAVRQELMPDEVWEGMRCT